MIPVSVLSALILLAVGASIISILLLLGLVLRDLKEGKLW
jgi:hypothetical protein